MLVYSRTIWQTHFLNLFQEKTMQLYVLTPFNPLWPIAQFKKIESIVVRASSEAKARDMVKVATFYPEKSKIGRQINNPWQNRSFSKCEIYQGTEFSKEGKEEILFPSTLHDLYQQLKKQ